MTAPFPGCCVSKGEPSLLSKKRAAAIAARFGKPPDNRYEDEDFRCIRSYYDYRREKEPETFALDETTWYDLYLDTLFERVSSTGSASGEQLLYYQLRCPAMERDEYERRHGLIRLMEEQPELRQKLQVLLSRLGKTGGARTIEAFSPSAHGKCGLVVALLLLVGLIGSGIGLIVSPAALPFLLLFLFGNPIYHIAMLRRLETHLPAASYSVSLIAVFQKICRLYGKELAAYLRPYEAAEKRTRALSRMGFSAFAYDNEFAQILNSLCLFDLILYEWTKVGLSRLRENIFAVHECVGRLDAAIAVASYRKRAAVYCDPAIDFDKEGPSHFTVAGLVHPLLKNPVANTVELTGSLLLTGSNASGKSTLIKAAALSAIMAQSLCTAPCTAYSASAFHVYTSMALSDDILAGESYFITELKAFRRILTAVERGERVLCAIDEILRGTNTVERIAASSTLLRYLAGETAVCIAATHDIELCALLSDAYDMAHFEEAIAGDTIAFDYRLRPGPACTRNAIRLLTLMGFDKALTQEAENRAERYLQEGVW